MSLNLTPEEIVLLDKFAADAIPTYAQQPLEGYDRERQCIVAIDCYALAIDMIRERREILAEHAAPTVKDSLSVGPMPETLTAHRERRGNEAQQ